MKNEKHTNANVTLFLEYVNEYQVQLIQIIPMAIKNKKTNLKANWKPSPKKRMNINQWNFSTSSLLPTSRYDTVEMIITNMTVWKPKLAKRGAGGLIQQHSSTTGNTKRGFFFTEGHLVSWFGHGWWTREPQSFCFWFISCIIVMSSIYVLNTDSIFHPRSHRLRERVRVAKTCTGCTPSG